jgi:signal transduction histidine kinase
MKASCHDSVRDCRARAGSSPGVERLLILDPLERLAPVLRKDLERSGCSVIVASRWQPAEDSGNASARSSAPAVVLFDGLPGCGFEESLAAEIAASFPSNPPLVIAVVAEVDAGIAWMAAGAAYMIKFPVPGALLQVVVRRAIEIHRARRGILERLDRQAEILRGFGHDLRNQINAILGCVQLLETEEGTTSSMAEDLALIRRNSRSIIGLAERLLEKFQGGETDPLPESPEHPAGRDFSQIAENSRK